MLLLAIFSVLTAQLRAATPAAASDPAAQGKRALAIIARAMSDEDSDVRSAAAAAWGEIGNPAPSVVELLHKAAKDRNAYVRIEAAFSLHLLGDESAVPVLERVVRASSATVKSSDPQAELKLLARSKSRVRAIQRLSEVGGVPVVELLDKTRQDPSGEVRDATAIALAKMGLDEFIPPFLQAFKDQDENVRAAAVRALAEIGRGAALEALGDAAADPSVVVREEAMRALAKFSSPESVSLLAKGAKDADRRVQAQALSGLAQIPDGDTAPLLREALKGSKAPEVQLKAMAGLARRGDRVDIPLAEVALTQKDPDLRVLALDVLDAVKTQASSDALARAMESDPDGRLRVHAASILVRRLQHKGGSQP
jgi:HEAT repeat protein